jgi:hypothetical protein
MWKSQKQIDNEKDEEIKSLKKVVTEMYNDEDMYLYAIYYKNSLINTPLNILSPREWFNKFNIK